MRDRDHEDRDAEPFVVVLQSMRPADIATAKSLLEDAGIPYLAKGDDLMGTMIPMLVGGVEIEVKARDAERARRLLSGKI